VTERLSQNHGRGAHHGKKEVETADSGCGPCHAATCSTVACLLYRLQGRDPVQRFYPILEDLLKAKYRYPDKSYSPLLARCRGLTHSNRHLLLERIEKTLTLEDVERWLARPGSGWLARLYLLELRQAKGGPPMEINGLVFRLTIASLDHVSGKVLAEITGDYPAGEPASLELPPYSVGAKPVRISFTPVLKRDVLNHDRWVISTSWFSIDHPVGCAFELEIPLNGSDSNRTRDAMGLVTRWRVTHSGSPPER
jgi:hypothetical protein